MESPPENMLAKFIPPEFEIQQELCFHPVYIYRHKHSGCPMAAMAGGYKGTIIGGVIYYREQHDSMNMEVEAPMEMMDHTMRFVETIIRGTPMPKDGIEGIWSRFQDDLYRILISKNFFTKSGTPASVHLKSKESPVDRKRIKLDEPKPEDECMICMERPPDTTVAPCMHNVVCSVCSIQLENSADAKICCQCRCEISGIYYPDNTVKEIGNRIRN